ADEATLLSDGRPKRGGNLARRCSIPSEYCIAEPQSATEHRRVSEREEQRCGGEGGGKRLSAGRRVFISTEEKPHGQPLFLLGLGAPGSGHSRAAAYSCRGLGERRPHHCGQDRRVASKAQCPRRRPHADWGPIDRR